MPSLQFRTALMNLTVLAAGRTIAIERELFRRESHRPCRSLAEEVLKTMLATRLKSLFACSGYSPASAHRRRVFAQQLRCKMNLWARHQRNSVLAMMLNRNQAEREEEEKKVGTARALKMTTYRLAKVPSQSGCANRRREVACPRASTYYEPVTQQVNGGFPVTSYQQKVRVQSTTHDAADVSVFDTRERNRLAAGVEREIPEG